MQGHVPVASALRSLRQKDPELKLEDSLDHVARPC